MADRLCLFVCSVLAEECQAIRAMLPPEVVIRAIPVDCDQASAFGAWAPRLEAEARLVREQGDDVHILAGPCLAEGFPSPGGGESWGLTRAPSCLQWLVGETVLEGLRGSDDWVISPGVLTDWKKRFRDRDVSGQAARSRAGARRLVLLDTGTDRRSRASLLDLARYLRLPAESLSVGVEHFGLVVTHLVDSWRLEKGTAAGDADARISGNRMARIRGALAALVAALSEDEVVSCLIEIAEGPERPGRTAAFVPWQAAPPGSSGAVEGRSRPEAGPRPDPRIREDYFWTPGRTEFLLRVGHGLETYGFVRIAGLDPGEAGESDFGQVRMAADVAGIALSHLRGRAGLRDALDRADAAGRALRVVQDEARSLLEGLPIGIYRSSPTGDILDTNPALARMLGYPDAESLKAAHATELHLDPRARETWLDLMERNGLVDNFEMQLRCLDGSIIWVRDTARAVRGQDGRCVWYEGTLEDITRRKKTESALTWSTRVRNAVGIVAGRLVSPITLEDMSALVLDHARRLTQSRLGIVGYVKQATGRFIAAAERTESPARPADRVYLGPWEWIARNRKPLLVGDPAQDPRLASTPGSDLPAGPFMAVPALMDGDLVGMILLGESSQDFSGQELEAVQRLAELYAIAVHRARTEDELRALSHVDDLTGLYNRRGFFTLAEQQLRVANRTRKEMFLLFADLDNLKGINDSLGHRTGDEALQAAGAILRELFRESDIVARIGGDEFVVLALDAGEGRPEVLTERLRDRVGAWNAAERRPFTLSLSLGTAVYDPLKPCTVVDLVGRADVLMYGEKTVKQNGAA